MSEGRGQEERRASRRGAPKGTVSVLAGDYDVRGRVANVSRGGLLAHTLVTVPERLLESPVELEIRFDTQVAAWLRLGGRIVRIAPTSVAVAFSRVPDDFDQIIADSLTASYSRRRVLAIVIVDATLERRSRMAEAFRAAGCAVVDVSTPLEAIVRLGEFHFEPDLIAIADTLPSTIASEMRDFVTREHPRAKLVTIGDDIVEPVGLAHWLSAANPGDDLARRVLALLSKPRGS